MPKVSKSKYKSKSKSAKKKSKSKKNKCLFINSKNKRCTNLEAVHGSWFCNTHLNKLYNLKLKPSAIKGAGNGLFAGSQGFKKGDIIGEYSRYDIKETESHFKKRCSKTKSHKCSEYVYCDNDNSCWDARYKESIIVRYANDARGSKNNAEFDNFGKRAFMMANKNIKPNSEIFCDYGDEYDWSFLEK